MACSHEVLSHTADTGIAVEADSLAELFACSAEGMFGLMYDIGGLTPDRHDEFVVEATGAPDLMVDLLAELLYRSEADDVVPCTFVVPEASETRVRIRTGVVSLRHELLIGPPIKAVTYHDLAVAGGRDGRWRARLVFDV
jgi:SHS2 domain-containing protein